MEALEATVNKPDSARMHALSAKEEPVMRSLFTEPGSEIEICD